MKTRISVQERLKDLRVEQGLNLEELAQKTGISKSALGDVAQRLAEGKWRNPDRNERTKGSETPL